MKRIYKISFSVLIFGLAISFGTTTSDARMDLDCGDVCNDFCYTNFMDPCGYTWCEVPEQGGGTWMCLGQNRAIR
jgi:hypothetical protein